MAFWLKMATVEGTTRHYYINCNVVDPGVMCIEPEQNFMVKI